MRISRIYDASYKLSQTPKQLAGLAESLFDENFISTIAKTAKENQIQVVGSFYEKYRQKDRVYDTLIVNKLGKVIMTHRKIHLYDALGFRESDKMASGSNITKPVRHLEKINMDDAMI